ncbi:MAG: YbaB/EbfC family nucleoid-associated protein [Clostridiales bacterium]|nr:YbaB/EbfC family nucleoid-associated protein [Clostridiales bacterium]
MAMANWGDMGRMMKQIQKMQEELLAVQEKLGTMEVEGSAGGGAVKAVCNGRAELLRLVLAPEVVDPEDTEMLADLVVAAVNEAMRLARQKAEEEMARVTGGLQLPGLPF